MVWSASFFLCLLRRLLQCQHPVPQGWKKQLQRWIERQNSYNTTSHLLIIRLKPTNSQVSLPTNFRDPQTRSSCLSYCTLQFFPDIQWHFLILLGLFQSKQKIYIFSFLITLDPCTLGQVRQLQKIHDKLMLPFYFVATWQDPITALPLEPLELSLGAMVCQVPLETPGKIRLMK